MENGKTEREREGNSKLKTQCAHVLMKLKKVEPSPEKQMIFAELNNYLEIKIRPMLDKHGEKKLISSCSTWFVNINSSYLYSPVKSN